MKGAGKCGREKDMDGKGRRRRMTLECVSLVNAWPCAITCPSIPHHRHTHTWCPFALLLPLQHVCCQIASISPETIRKLMARELGIARQLCRPAPFPGSSSGPAADAR